MERNIEQELDDLKRQIEEIKKLLDEKQESHHKKQKGKPEYIGKVRKMHGMHPDPAIEEIRDRLENITGD